MVGSSEGSRQARRRGARRKATPGNFLGKPGTWLLFLSLAALAVVLSSNLLPVPSPIHFIASLTLFMTPGAVLAGMLLRGSEWDLDLPAVVPIAFALSAGGFGVFALPQQVLQLTLLSYLLICGAVLSLSMVGVAFFALRVSSPEETCQASNVRSNWLWVPLVILTAVLGIVSLKVVHAPTSDFWTYVLYVQKYLSPVQLDGLVLEAPIRTSVSGWLLEEAALSWVSGISPVELLTAYLAPILIVVSILALYGLALSLFQDRSIALLSASLAAVFFLVQLDSSLLTTGDQFVGRITEDKFLVSFIFLPVALSLAVQFLRERRLQLLGLFTFVCWSVVSIHAIGLILIGISMTGFGLVHMAINWRKPEAWKSFGALGAGLASIALPPLVYLLVAGSSALSILGASSTALDKFETDKLLSTAQKNEHLLVLGDGSYIMHPSFVLEPATLAAYVLGVPFLIFKAKRSLAAQLLLGTLLFTAALVYIPPLATFAGSIVDPWTIWRLAWPIPLATVLTLGWMAWELLDWLRSRLSNVISVRRMTPFLPVLFTCALVVVFMPSMVAGVRSADEQSETTQSQDYCLDPAFPWLQRTITTPTTILALPAETSCFSAYTSDAGYVSYRNAALGDRPPSEAPKETKDVQAFFRASVLDGEMISTLNRYTVGHVLLPSSSPLDQQLEHLPAFNPLDTPGERYRLYKVEQDKLQVTPIIEANGYLNENETQKAVEAYKAASATTDDEKYLVYTGLGRAYLKLEQPEKAVQSLEQTVRRSPKDPAALALLAKAYTAAKDLPEARNALEEAVSLDPRNVELRFKLADALQETQKKDAVEQYKIVVREFPNVPEYRINLGQSLNLSEDFADANNQFERAIRLDPRSPLIYGQVAQANRLAGRPAKAVDYYEKALDLDPDKSIYSLQLGQTYLKLWKREKDDSYLESAEKQLQKASNSQASTDSQQARAQLTLGKVYERWKKPEEAIAAYERALKIDPDLKPARRSLEKLKGR